MQSHTHTPRRTKSRAASVRAWLPLGFCRVSLWLWWFCVSVPTQQGGGITNMFCGRASLRVLHGASSQPRRVFRWKYRPCAEAEIWKRERERQGEREREREGYRETEGGRWRRKGENKKHLLMECALCQTVVQYSWHACRKTSFLQISFLTQQATCQSQDTINSLGQVNKIVFRLIGTINSVA